MRANRILVVMGVGWGMGLICVAAGEMAWAEASLSPAWSHSDYLISRPNSSWLDGMSRGADNSNLLSAVMDQKSGLQMKQKLDDLNRDYELKDAYGLNGPGMEQYQQNRISSGGFNQNDLIQVVTSYQSERNRTMLYEASERTPGLKPAVVAGYGAAAVYTGRPFHLKIDDDTGLQASTSVRKRSGDLQLRSSMLNAGFTVKMANPETRDPAAPPPVDPTQVDERYKLSVSRDLPFLDISSQLAYGSSSNTVSASVKKPITEHLAAVVDSVYSTPIGGRVGLPSQEVLRILYGVTF